MRQGLDVQLITHDELRSPAEQAQILSPSLRALSDPNRLHLVLLLAEGPKTVRELTDATGMSQTLVSHHLTPLREQQLVSVTPQGRSNVYELCCENLATPLRMLATVVASSPLGVEACCTPSTLS